MWAHCSCFGGLITHRIVACCLLGHIGGTFCCLESVERTDGDVPPMDVRIPSLSSTMSFFLFCHTPPFFLAFLFFTSSFFFPLSSACVAPRALIGWFADVGFDVGIRDRQDGLTHSLTRTGAGQVSQLNGNVNY